MQANSLYLIDVIGFLAAVLTTGAFVPQAWLIWKTKRADSVSLGMYSIFTCGTFLWLVYGVAIGAWPVIAANAVSLALALCILAMKIRFG